MFLNWQSARNRNIVFQRFGAVRLRGGLPVVTPGRFTDDFIYAATADLRCPKAMVEVTWASSSVDESRVITQNDINRINRTGQLFNGRTESGQKWAYIHSGLKADGTFHVMPELDTDEQAGWYGFEKVSDGSGDFSPAPWLQVDHLARSYTSISIAGDSEYDEYPVDFTITYTHPGGPTVQVITGNTERVYAASFTAIADVTAIRITITKWSAINTIVKVTQIAGALIVLYKSDEITELNILEETNSDTGIVPVGNVSSNELDLALLNTDRRFSYGNTESIYVSSLRSGRKIRVWLGFILPVGSADVTGDVPGYIVETVSGEKIGYMPYGVYWSKDWISSYSSQVTTTTAYDITYRLSQTDFLRSDIYTGTVESIVDTLLNLAKADVPDLVWEVSADTAAINWADVSFEAKSYLEVLKDIAEATLSYSFVNRFGLLVIGSRLEAQTPVENYATADLSVYYNYQSNPKIDELINTIRVGYTEPALSKRDIYTDQEIFTIPGGGTLNFDILWNKGDVDTGSVVITLNPLVGNAEISSTTISATGANITAIGDPGDTFNIAATDTGVVAIYSADEVFTIPAGGVSTLYIAWSKSPVVLSSVIAGLIDTVGSPLITDFEAYAYGGDIEITGNPGDQFKITATGTPYDAEENTETTASEAASILLYGIREFALTGNILITTAAQAQAIADELITFYGALRQDGSIEWPASTLLAVGDTVEVTEFKSDTVETKDFFLIQRQSTKFNGAMQGQTELRRG